MNKSDHHEIKRTTINQIDSSSDDDDTYPNLSDILNQLIPALHHRRSSLINILKLTQQKTNILYNYHPHPQFDKQFDKEGIKNWESNSQPLYELGHWEKRSHRTRSQLVNKITQNRKWKDEQQEKMGRDTMKRRSVNIQTKNDGMKADKGRQNLRNQNKKSIFQIDYKKIQKIDQSFQQKLRQQIRQQPLSENDQQPFNSEQQKYQQYRLNHHEKYNNCKQSTIKSYKTMQNIKNANQTIAQPRSAFTSIQHTKYNINICEEQIQQKSVSSPPQSPLKINKKINCKPNKSAYNFLTAIQENQYQNNVIHTEQNQRYKSNQFIRYNTPKFDLYSLKSTSTSIFVKNQIKIIKEQKEKALFFGKEIASILEKKLRKQNKDKQHPSEYRSLSDKRNSNLTLLHTNSNQTFLQSIKQLFSQICELNTRAQCYKYKLKNRQYQILKYLYPNYIEKGLIYLKQLNNGIKVFFKNQQKQMVNIIVKLIFGNKQFICFDQFGEIFAPNINKNQYNLLSIDHKENKKYQLTSILRKLFSVRLQIHYFQQQLIKIAVANSTKLLELLRMLQDRYNPLTIESLLQLITLPSSSNHPTNNLKTKLYLSHKFPNPSPQQLLHWLDTKTKQKQSKPTIKQSFNKGFEENKMFKLIELQVT